MKHDNDSKYWKKEADRLFSLYKRQEFKDHLGHTECATCEGRGLWRNMDAGHFRSRKHNSTRCHELNALAQCSTCNRGDGKGNHANGEAYLMGKKLDEVYGEGTADRMVQLSRQSVKMDWLDWKQAAEKYKQKLILKGFEIR